MPVRNVFIISDLEGAHSVTRFSQTRSPGRALEKARRLHTEQANAMIRGIREFDPEIRVHVWDSHGHGGIDRDGLDDVHAFLPPGWLHLVDYFESQKIDALFFESAHAMGCTPRANLSHTMSSRKVLRYVLNGSDIGEIGLRAAIAGEANVPVSYLNGDDKACAEARAIMPWIITTTTKISISLQSAKELPRDTVMANIASDVAKALQINTSPCAYYLSGPIRLVIQLRWREAFLKRVRSFFKRSRRNFLRYEATNITELVNEKVL